MTGIQEFKNATDSTDFTDKGTVKIRAAQIKVCEICVIRGVFIWIAGRRRLYL